MAVSNGHMFGGEGGMALEIAVDCRCLPVTGRIEGLDLTTAQLCEKRVVHCLIDGRSRLERSRFLVGC
jgi:hypothetical protein